MVSTRPTGDEDPRPAGAPGAALESELRERAARLGFSRVGVARAGPLREEGERLRRWLAAGRHAGMAWMQDTVELRIDPRREGMLPSARSVVVLVAPYARDARRVGPAPGRVARYARGRDYHRVLRKRLRRLSAWLRERGHEARGVVDSAPVFERAWAARAGVGFIGKSCCLIVPGLGSHVLLASLITSAELTPGEPMGERCGSCRLCLDACPTRALVAPNELDSRRCVSYLTVESRGPVPEPLRASLGDWLFGCDACQDVCPFNHTRPPPAALTAPFAPDPRMSTTRAAVLLGLDDAAFDLWSRGSPLRRPGRAGMARNAANVLGNHGGARDLPALLRAAQRDADAGVRRACAHAAVLLEGRLARAGRRG